MNSIKKEELQIKILFFSFAAAFLWVFVNYIGVRPHTEEYKDFILQNSILLLIIDPVREEFIYRYLLFFIFQVNFYKCDVLEDLGNGAIHRRELQRILSQNAEKPLWKRFIYGVFDSKYRALGCFKKGISGMYKSKMRNSLKVDFVILLSAIVFAGAHYFSGCTLSDSVRMFLVGLYFAIAYYYSRSLFVPIMMHLALNLVNVYIVLMS